VCALVLLGACLVRGIRRVILCCLHAGRRCVKGERLRAGHHAAGEYTAALNAAAAAAATAVLTRGRGLWACLLRVRKGWLRAGVWVEAERLQTHVVGGRVRLHLGRHVRGVARRRQGARFRRRVVAVVLPGHIDRVRWPGLQVATRRRGAARRRALKRSRLQAVLLGCLLGHVRRARKRGQSIYCMW
jgi:hypothetical protein